MPTARRNRYSLPLVGAGLLIIAASASLIWITLSIESAARGLVAGEALFAEAQKSAVFHLDRYAETGNQQHLELFHEAMRIPLGDEIAREELMSDAPDLDRAAEGLLIGGNHPDDIPGMIQLFRYGQYLPQLQPAIDAWVRASVLIDELGRVGDDVAEAWIDGSPGAARIGALRGDLMAVDEQLRPLADRFSETLDNTSRWLTSTLSALATIILCLLLVLLIRIFNRMGLRLDESRSRINATFEQAAVGIGHLSLDGTYLKVNQKLAAIVGSSQEAMVGRSFRDYTLSADLDHDETGIRDMLSGAFTEYTVDKRYRREDGREIWVKVTANLVRDAEGRPEYFVTVVQDISEAKQLSEALHQQATCDALTGLMNRSAFDEVLAHAIERAKSGDAKYVLVFVDLDQFKLVNDTAGHSAGDILLKRIAGLIRSRVRDEDVVARFGGDEFALLLEGCDADAAMELMERVRTAIDEFQFHWVDRVFTLGMSAGVACIDETSADSQKVMTEADMACYTAKERGRNQICLHREDDTSLRRRAGDMRWASRITEALKRDAFVLYAQPIEPLCAGPATGQHYEILLRMRGDDGHLISPGSFIQAAERFNQITRIDRWTISSTLAWLEAHPAHLDQLSLCSINLSGQTVTSEGMLGYILAQLDASPVPNHKICFEITETAAVSDIELAQKFMSSLQERGCRLALDDFGSGVSSFRYLQELPADFIKIDGSFVRQLADRPLDESIVGAIAAVSKVAGKQTIAEFVEDQRCIDALRRIGVDYVQGFGICRPAPLEEIAERGTDLAWRSGGPSVRNNVIHLPY